jgi:2-oxoglutarate dehydrogenase E2 component (dihydrolipoamide succinyltransferase)
MATDITMPKLGESVVEGTISRWLKRPGDRVAQYEALLEVQTDKVDTEVPAPAAGILEAIVIPEGTTVRVGTVIARLAAVDTAPAAGATAETQEDTPAATPSAAIPRERAPGAPPISPVVARMAAEHSLDLAAITGTGAGGRVSKKDVERYLAERAAPPPAAPAAIHEPPAAEAIPLSPMRRAIAEHMLRSVQTSPHVTTVFEVDVSRIIAHRAAVRGEYERQGLHLTYTAYFALAAAAALRANPRINATMSDAGVVQHREVHLGIAVALDDGLIVPVVRHADEKNLFGMARAIADLADRARGQRLHPDETRGGTFTLTNHGVAGSLFATPIINQPQAAILGVGAIQKRPVVVSDAHGDAIAIRPLCYLSLSFDHRLADGAIADRFLADVKRIVENSNFE